MSFCANPQLVCVLGQPLLFAAYNVPQSPALVDCVLVPTRVTEGNVPRTALARARVGRMNFVRAIVNLRLSKRAVIRVSMGYILFRNISRRMFARGESEDTLPVTRSQNRAGEQGQEGEW